MALITPKYLTKKLAESAAAVAFRAVFGWNDALDLQSEIPFRQAAGHLVILVPAMEDAREADYPNWPNYSLQPYCLYEVSENKDIWTGKYDEIARCKALQRWTDRADGGATVTPHLLFSGDTPYWGSVKREGIVAAFSGIQPEFDRLTAQIAVDTLIALALHAFKNDTSLEGLDFLP
jgi:hypothetical protein